MRMIRCAMLATTVVLAFATTASAQILQGEWVRASEQRIDQVRKTDVRVIVLDENDQVVADAPVRIEQLQHAFPVGFTLRDRTWPTFDADAPVWRSFNAVALEGNMTGWPGYEALGKTGREALHDVIARARSAGMHVRWGGGISADLAQNPDWLSGLSKTDQQLAIETHARRLVERVGWQVNQLDLYTDALDHDLLESRFGEPMLRRLYEQAQADSPASLRLGIRVHDRLRGERLNELVKAVTGWRQAFIPIDVVVIEQRVQGSLVHGPVERALAWLDELDISIAMVGLEVGGASEAAAAVNMETLLRTLFADATVEGIWFGAMRPDTVGAPNAALFNDAGEPTAVGRAVDDLFAKLWWSDETLRTDELGNARARVFAGTYRVTAVLPDEQELAMRVELAKQAEERIVVLQPMK